MKDYKQGKYTITEYADGSKYWYLNGKRHREDGPAVELSAGTKIWCLNGDLHREDGPAVEYPDGIKLWYLNSKKLTEAEFKTALFKKNLKEILDI